MVKIKVKDLFINDVTNVSGVFSGQNLQLMWRHVAKENMGVATVSGDQNTYCDNYNTVIDTDFLDVLNNKPGEAK